MRVQFKQTTCFADQVKQLLKLPYNRGKNECYVVIQTRMRKQKRLLK